MGKSGDFERPSNSSPSILVLHVHWNNRGDEAAVRAMVDSLRFSFPGCKIRIMIFAKNLIDFPYEDIQVLKPYPVGPAHIIDCLSTLLSMGRVSFTHSGREFLEAVDEAEVVIHAPGGPSIGDIYRGRYWSYTYLYRFIVSRILKKKPFFFYAPSMGPFTCKFDNIIRRVLLKRANAIVLRESRSAEYLASQLGLESVVTCDSALQNAISDSYIERYDDLGEILELTAKEKFIGITLTDLRWHPMHKRNSSLPGLLDRSLSGAAKGFLEKGYRILLIPQLFGDNSDMELLQKFSELDSSRILILPGNVDSYGQQVIISRLHSLIAMRYHSSIFAAKGRVPFLSICYEHKMTGFMDLLGLPDLAMNAEHLTEEDIISKFEYLERNYERIGDVLRTRVPELEKLSGETTEIIARCIGLSGKSL